MYPVWIMCKQLQMDWVRSSVRRLGTAEYQNSFTANGKELKQVESLCCFGVMFYSSAVKEQQLLEVACGTISPLLTDETCDPVIGGRMT